MKIISKLTAGLICLLATLAYAKETPFARVQFSPSSIEIQSLNTVDAISVRIVGAGNFNYQQQFRSNNVHLDLSTLKFTQDGNYSYEITGTKYTGETRVVSGNGREPGAEVKQSKVRIVTGHFKVKNYSIVGSSKRSKKTDDCDKGCEGK